MKYSQYFIPTLKEIPKDAEAKSHVMMLRSGMIRKLASGYYSYLPLGLRTLQKIETIVREEMNGAGALEVLMPAVHPSDIWKKTGRYEVMDEILLKIEKGGKEYVLGPTHEEIITELATAYLKSYKELPKIFYQIQNKFRHEARPRFGVIRSREFIMKDAYSFDRDEKDLAESYDKMFEAYHRIFRRCGLDFITVQADTGAMGGSSSHEFMVLVDFGEDHVALCSCGYSASVEVAPCIDASKQNAAPVAANQFQKTATPNVRSIEEVSSFLNISSAQCIKTLIYLADGKPVACLVRGDFEICEPKLAKKLGAKKLFLADEKTVLQIGGVSGFVGPVGLASEVRILADHSILKQTGGSVVGANEEGFHFTQFQAGDIPRAEWGDYRKIIEGDLCPQCQKEKIKVRTTLEIGHVFKLGKRYTLAFDGKYLDQTGKTQDILMGCYGIGVNRILASCIEQRSGEKGMVWPVSIAPFTVSVVTANQQSAPVVEAAEKLYCDLIAKGVDVLYDDRDERMGPKLNDAELVGIPIQVILGDRGLKEGKIEIRDRRFQQMENIPVAESVGHILNLLEKKWPF